MDKVDFDEFVLANMPHFIAVNYQRLLEAQTAQERVERILHIYDLGLRALTIGVVSQYLTRDRDRMSDPYLNDLLLQKFPCLTLDAWQQLFFASLRAYEGKRDLFFMPELYDFYWDTSMLPHRQRVEVEQPFERLTQVAVEVRTERVLPQDEGEWEKLAAETMGLLQQILRDTVFIEKYDLIRVLDYDQLFYDYELHKGLRISTGRESLPKYVSLSRGWFYLREGTEDFLHLHPLLVFWEEESRESEPVQTDTGVYDRYVYNQLQYLLATLGKKVVDEESVRAFVTLLYDTIEETKRKRQETEKFTWWQLRDICVDITKRRMATVRHKYRGELYLQRDKTRQAFERFLESEKRCFVLIGKSGVGKSNFLLALGEELQTQSDICVLMYDGTQLKVEPSMTDVISQDFDDRLILAGRRVQHVWREIAKVDGIEGRLVILYVDAINENLRAKELLSQLDELVQGPWSWLKVVFSSRPETWQTIKRGVRLAEALYYQEEGAKTLGVELEPFSYSERMDPFTRQELPEAYAKHQQVFNLRTEYGDLRVELREMLREPLNLWLVAKTYEGKAIPDTLKVTELIEQYVNALLRSERLWEEDLRLLEKQLVPLMVREGYYSNAITLAGIDAAGGGLYEAVYSEQVLSDGRRMNESFTNLVDAEILIRQGEGREQSIAFKYERFYEYFVGKALFEELGSKDSWQEKYGKWIAQLSQTPYLWGAVKNCLEQQFRVLQPEECAILCVGLAQIPNQRMIEIVITALTEYGTDDYEKVLKVIEKMLMQGRGWLRSILRRETVTAQCPAWKRAGMDVASNLGMGDLLEFALADPSPAVRAVAIRHTFIYWRREREEGFTLLKNLVDRSVGFLGLPRPQLFESSLGLSLIILFDDFKDAETIAELQEFWRLAIERLLRVNRKHLGGRRERVKGWVRTVLLRIATGFVVRTAREAPSNSVLSIPEFKQFFKQDGNLERRRAVARKLVQYMDVTTTDIRDVRDDLLELVAERDMFISIWAYLVMRRHSNFHLGTVLPLLKELFDKTIEIEPIGTFCVFIPIAIPLEKELGSDESRTLCRQMIITYLDRCRGKWWSHLQERRFTYLDALCFAEAGDDTDVSLTPVARQYVESMIMDGDYDWIKDIVQWEVTLRAIEAGYLRFAFSVLEMLVNIQDSSVREAVIELLARMRVYYPDEVDDFMEVNDLEEQFTMTVRTRAPSETIGDLLDLRALMFWHEAIMLGGSPELWQRVMWLFGQLPECRSLGQWLTILFKTAINLIYGGPVFLDIPA